MKPHCFCGKWGGGRRPAAVPKPESNSICGRLMQTLQCFGFFLSHVCRLHYAQHFKPLLSKQQNGGIMAEQYTFIEISDRIQLDCTDASIALLCRRPQPDGEPLPKCAHGI